MIVKTEALAGPALDWAVWLAIHGEAGVACNTKKLIYLGGHVFWNPSVSWSQCRPLLEKYKVGLFYHEWYEVEGVNTPIWEAMVPSRQFGPAECYDPVGETPLVAACRAIVAAELGSEVDVPEELL